MRLVQEVWGEGFATPGGGQHIRNMVKIFRLDPAMSVLDLGAGLGGTTRTMSANFGVWVTGLEASPEPPRRAWPSQSRPAWERRPPSRSSTPRPLSIGPKSINCVFSKEFLYTVKDKSAFLRNVESIMKPRGQLLFTDLVLARAGQSSPALLKWMEFEPVTPHTWAVQDYKEALASLHLDIRVVEDLTEPYHKMVTRAWADYIKMVEIRGIAAEDSAALVNEVELWDRRIKAIEAGDLQVTRIYALKKDTSRLMSDW